MKYRLYIQPISGGLPPFNESNWAAKAKNWSVTKPQNISLWTTRGASSLFTMSEILYICEFYNWTLKVTVNIEPVEEESDIYEPKKRSISIG